MCIYIYIFHPYIYRVNVYISSTLTWTSLSLIGEVGHVGPQHHQTWLAGKSPICIINPIPQY